MKLSITQTEYHRNGISGAPFHVMTFHQEDRRQMLGVVFAEPYHVAVFDMALLSQGNIRFGTNSFRGDCFEPTLRRAIAGLQAKEA